MFHRIGARPSALPAACPGPCGDTADGEFQAILVPTEFGKTCAKLWLRLHGRRFSALERPRADKGRKRGVSRLGTDVSIVAKRRAHADRAVVSTATEGKLGGETVKLETVKQKPLERMAESAHWNRKFAAFHRQTRRVALQKEEQERARVRGRDPFPVPPLRLGPGRAPAAEPPPALQPPTSVFVAVGDSSWQVQNGRITVSTSGLRALEHADVVIVDAIANVSAMPERRMGGVELWMAMLIVGIGKCVVTREAWVLQRPERSEVFHFKVACRSGEKIQFLVGEAFRQKHKLIFGALGTCCRLSAGAWSCDLPGAAASSSVRSVPLALASDVAQFFRKEVRVW